MIRVALLAAVLALVGAPVAAAEPGFLTRPVPRGGAAVGGQPTASGADVVDATDEDVTLAWERSAPAGGFLPVSDAFGATYSPQPEDLGLRLRVHAVVETATGRAETWSEPSAVVGGLLPSSSSSLSLRIGPAKPAGAGPAAALSRWIVTTGESVAVRGQLNVDAVSVDEAVVVLEPTVAAYADLRVVEQLSITSDGRLAGSVVPTVNAVVWLELRIAEAEPVRVQLGVVGVRPRIRLRLGAQPDGRDSQGRALVRDLTVLPGSVIAPGVSGLRLGWEGILPGERRGTAVCRTSERVTSQEDGMLSGRCATRGAWGRARWRLVFAPATADPGATPFLAAASNWVYPAGGRHVPVLPRVCATLAVWNSATYNT